MFRTLSGCLAILVLATGCMNITHSDFSNRSVVYTGCHTVETSRGEDGSKAMILFWEIPPGMGWTFFKQVDDKGEATDVSTGQPC